MFFLFTAQIKICKQCKIWRQCDIHVMGKGEGKFLIKLGTDRQASGFQGSSFALSLGSVES